MFTERADNHKTRKKDPNQFKTYNSRTYSSVFSRCSHCTRTASNSPHSIEQFTVTDEEVRNASQATTKMATFGSYSTTNSAKQ